MSFKMSIHNLPFELACTRFMGHFSPPVVKKEDCYRIRVLKSQSFNSFSGNRTQNFEYFECDLKGKITRCPRGLTKEFKGVVLVDLDEYIENQPKS